MIELYKTIRWQRLLLSVGLGALVAAFAAAPRAAADPACRGRYLSQNGVVIDKDTKLTWQQQHFENKLSQPDADNYCNNLSLDGRKFRLPTIFELQTLVDDSGMSPLIDNDAFPYTPEDIFWSSTGRVDCPTCKWYVNFGFTKYDLVDATEQEEPHYVRCVH